MKTLYITDLDGTFLDNSGAVSQKSIQIINSLSDKGLLFSIATSRSLMTAREIIKDIKISAPIVLMSGVFVYDLNADRPVKYYEIASESFFKLMDIYQRHDKAPFVTFYGDDGRFTLKFTELKLQLHRDFYNSRSQMPGYNMKRVKSVDIDDKTHPVFISLCDRYDDLLPIKAEIDLLDGISYSFYQDTYTKYWFLEVFNGKASKAQGLETVRQYLNVTKAVAFGDNLNDIPLFNAADECYAVNNAVTELKELATGIIPSNEENGVAQFIYNDFTHGN